MIFGQFSSPTGVPPLIALHAALEHPATVFAPFGQLARTHNIPVMIKLDAAAQPILQKRKMTLLFGLSTCSLLSFRIFWAIVGLPDGMKSLVMVLETFWESNEQ